jgi:CubicO group peptidase (beta-lactamase class C family)
MEFQTMALQLTRRRFLELSSLAAAGLSLDSRRLVAGENWDETIGKIMGAAISPGLAACRIEGSQVVWSAGFGWADIENKIPMTPDVILNIASVSKTITATGVMQLWEAGRLDLDVGVEAYLPFSVRNPRYPDTAITCRQLLAHRSSIKDGPHYDNSYICGESSVSLTDWISGYLLPGGRFYSGADNFHPWEPGTKTPPTEPRPYSNVGYGLLALVVENIVGDSFKNVTEETVFRPLGMDSTAWRIDRIDTARHAVPYTRVCDENGFPPDFPDPNSSLPRYSDPEPVPEGGLFPHCLYGFPNYPDGLLRTSVADLSRFLIAMMNGGILIGGRILGESTIASMLSDQHYGRALCWNATTLGGTSQRIWYHSGRDLGVMTFAGFRPEDQVGIFVMTNCDDFGPEFNQVVRALLSQTT